MTPTYTPQRRPFMARRTCRSSYGTYSSHGNDCSSLSFKLIYPLRLKGTSIAGGIYAAITALVSAFVAGYFAIKFSAPEAIFGDGTDIDPKDASLTGMLTAALIVLFTTFFTLSSATGILASAGNVIGGTVSTVTQAAGGIAAAGTSAAGTAAVAAPDSAIEQLQQRAQEAYQTVSGDISQEDLNALVARNTQGLNQEQIAATTNVLEEMINNTRHDVADMDFTSIDTWRNIDDYAKQRMASIEQTLKSDELINRLQKALLKRRR